MSDPPSRLEAGSEFAGYRIESVIGRGGMGIVYRAVSLDHLRRTVALKVVAPEHAEDPDFRERFISEARMAASIEHANVIPVYEARDVDGVLFLAMRFVDGTDLDALILAEGPLAPRRAAEIVREVAAALDRSHARKLVHRDVKPANILIEADGGHVLLTDFGIARSFDVSTASGSTHVIGTLDYMAPERFDGRLDHRADIYALGCVLYQALVGEIPFPRSTPAEKIWAHMNAPPPAPDALALPFRPVVARALAKDPDRRYASAGELARDVAAAAARCEQAATAVLPLAASEREPADEPDPSAHATVLAPLPPVGPDRSTQDTIVVAGEQAGTQRRPEPQRPRQRPRPPAPEEPHSAAAADQPDGGANRARKRRIKPSWAAVAIASALVGVAIALLIANGEQSAGEHARAKTSARTATTATTPAPAPTPAPPPETTTTETTPNETTTSPPAITEEDADLTLDDFAQAFNDLSTDELSQLLQDDVVRHDADGQAYDGSDAVLDRYAEVFDGYDSDPGFAFTSREYSAGPDGATVLARFTVDSGPEQDATFHLSRVDGGDPEIDDIDLR